MMGNWEVSGVDDARELFQWFAHKEERAYAISLKATGKVVGNLTVYNEPPVAVNTLSELKGKTGRSLSFSMARQFRRRGLMFEAVSAVIDHLFRVENVDYIHSGYLDFNLPSQMLHQKLGFTYLTTLRFPSENGDKEFVGIENILMKPIE